MWPPLSTTSISSCEGAYSTRTVAFVPPRVLDRVGERFLDHAVRGDLERSRQRPCLPFDRQLDVQLAVGRARDEVRQLCQVGLRSQLVRLVRPAQDAEQPVKLLDGLPARRLDRAQHFT